jgi:hypothetical protein
MSAKCLPRDVKIAINEMYSSNEPEYITRTLNYINGKQYDIDKFYQFIHTTKFGDAYRDESFENTFPKLYQHIKEYWNGIQ